MTISPRYLSDGDVVRLPWPAASGPTLSARSVRSSDILSAGAATTAEVRREMVTEWVRSYLAPLRSLPPNWDSYDGRPVTNLALEAAERLSTSLLLVWDAPWPSFVPRPDGGVALEWDRPDAELVIELPASDDPLRDATVGFSDFATSEEWEARLDEAGSRLAEAVSQMTV